MSQSHIHNCNAKSRYLTFVIRNLLLTVLLCCSTSAICFSQNEDSIARIMFYNVENLFDVYDDSLKNDNEFLPAGERQWTYKRMMQKFASISHVILNAGGWNMPVIVGLCEVENRWVLSALLRETGLETLGYRVVHHDSPDERGIDAALIYNSARFNVIASRPCAINLGKGERPTRDILYVKGILQQTDTLHILVNHWSSRLGGTVASRPKREKAAAVLKSVCDSIVVNCPCANIIMMGDFNEEPESDIMTNIVKSGSVDAGLPFINLGLYANGNDGTLKYQHTWTVFDQIMVSRTLTESMRVGLKQPVQQIIALPFLLEADPVYGGQRTARTYTGFKYAGGFSDHLPVMIELLIRK
ncbi:MAG: hypothetical protein LBV41_04200 [Cytophagaceae bacterium]|jgi:endonuclease/exonuclease/phosphatase family metal-dependent hydrolase|nr:hypothetical protein [Cytophagaceae bacterium]